VGVNELGPYAIEAELGRGGMGVVYRARDTRDGRVVALKVLRDALGDPELLERFRLEAKALRGLEHPNLVRVLDHDVSPPRPYAVFEFVPGETLQARVSREGPLPIPDAIRILSEVAAGLAAVHDRDLLHRDVKPENVLLGPAGAKLADFGLVKRLDGTSLTQSGTTLGTPSYLAPEQIGSDKARWGPSTDVYGLAATLFYALTGAPPFAGPSTLVTLSRVLNEDPPLPSALRPEVPEWLDAVCTRGLAKGNRERYPSAVAFRLALREGRPARAPTARHLAGALLAAACALGAVTLVAGRDAAPASGPPSSAAQANSASSPTEQPLVPRRLPNPLRSAQRVSPSDALEAQRKESNARLALERGERLEVTPRDVADAADVVALLQRCTELLELGRGGSPGVRETLLDRVWNVVQEAARLLEAERFAEAGGQEILAWYTARLDDPDYPPKEERRWDCVLRVLTPLRTRGLDPTRLTRWATVGDQLLDLDRQRGKAPWLRALLDVAGLHLNKHPADRERAAELVDRVRRRVRDQNQKLKEDEKFALAILEGQLFEGPRPQPDEGSR